MSTVPEVNAPPNEVPNEFTRRCEKGELGGVMLIFLNAKNTTEMEAKKAEVFKFAKRMQKKYPSPTGAFEPKKKEPKVMRGMI